MDLGRIGRHNGSLFELGGVVRTMIDEVIRVGWEISSQIDHPGLRNPKCFESSENGEHVYYADVTTFLGAHGRDLYNNSHQAVVDSCRDWTE